MVEGSEGGLNAEVVHWDAGKNHVDPWGLVTVPSVPGVGVFVSGTGQVCEVVLFEQCMQFPRCSCFSNMMVVW
jgi:hypothetical protein